MASNHFKQMQVELERLGYEYVSTNTRGGQTWEHPSHSLVIYPSMKEDAHRSVLRSCKKAVGVKEETNKRNTEGAIDPAAEVVLLNTGDGLKTLDAVAPTSQPTFTISPSFDDFETAVRNVMRRHGL